MAVNYLGTGIEIVLVEACLRWETVKTRSSVSLPSCSQEMKLFLFSISKPGKGYCVSHPDLLHSRSEKCIPGSNHKGQIRPDWPQAM